MFHVHLRRMCVLLLLSRLFYICLLGTFDLKYSSNPYWVSLLIFCLDDLSIVESGILKSLTIIVLLSIFPFRTADFCWVHLGALMLGPYLLLGAPSRQSTIGSMSVIGADVSWCWPGHWPEPLSESGETLGMGCIDFSLISLGPHAGVSWWPR